jgi:hypothetical protein
MPAAVGMKEASPLLMNMFNTGYGKGGGAAFPNHRLLQHTLYATKSSEATIGDSNDIEVAAASSLPCRPRSSSAGRVRPSGTDLVQDVYDRLGVKRSDLSQASPDDVAAMNHIKKYSALFERGRSRSVSDCNREEENRPRSLSRGRLQWPPQRTTSDLLDAKPSSKWDQGLDEPNASTARSLIAVIDSNSPAKSKSYRSVATAMYGCKEISNDLMTNPKESKGEKTRITEKKSDPVLSPVEELGLSARSLKERMKAFSASRSSKKAENVKVEKETAPRYPPQINLFDDFVISGSEGVDEGG